MSGFLKAALKRMLRSLGYELTSLSREADYRFAPRPEDRHKWLQAMGIHTVLDVGAHTGESAVEFRRIFPEAMIYSFEPIRDCFLELEARTAGMARQKSFNLALGDAEGEGEIHRSEYSPSSSLLEMSGLHKSAYPFSAAERIEPIQLRTLDGMAPSLDLAGEILLKIDTQGFEMKVLKGGENTLGAIRIVIVEASFGELYRGQPRFPEVYRWLEERGFEYRGSWDQFHNPKDGMPIQQDGIFIRP